MLTVEHCDAIHLHLSGNGGAATILSEAVLTALDAIAANAKRATDSPGAQTSAPTALQPPALGDVWPGQGGRYAGTMPARDGKPGYHLVLAETQNSSVKFGPYDHDVAGAGDHCDGLANTRALIADGTEHPAALWASELSVGCDSDFYLPAHNELMLMWICVPQLFDKQGWYWTSTQDSPDYAWVQVFEGGDSRIYYKGYEFRAVAVRRLAL